ncbi:MAG: LysM peptidoglycan-binding domain-containing protein [Candidatus Nealsonbacteria bacterium]
MDSYLKPFLGLKSYFHRNKSKIKGSHKDPFICLGSITILMFVLISLFSGSASNSLYNKGDFSLASLAMSVEKATEEDSFAGTLNTSFPDSPELLVLEENTLKASTPPSSFSPQVLGALIGGYDYADTKKIITEYEIESGDSLSSIASKFGISLNTILWANELNSSSLINPGQKLVILPVTGVLHYVKSGDTVSVIIQKYKAKTEDLLAFNNLSSEGDIYAGDILIIPNGTKPKNSYSYAPSNAPLADSYFICPIAGCETKITQGLHFSNAIDFSNGKCGGVIYSAAAGTVLKIKTTNSTSKYALNGYGNHMTIEHPNGVVTYYGHISASLVNVGDKVSQGQAIALMGGKPGTSGAGHSTGCHIHFGVYGARNPFAR